MSLTGFEDLSFHQQNRVRRAVVTAVEESMAHVARELEDAIAPAAREINKGWVQRFAQRFLSPNAAHGGSTDYIYERAFRAGREES